ncbi:MAG: chalcone isomerase family protein [Piscirickettsiaceae bacterium]|nr:chalcone isomerase family protein [Piscirickettsiaceae bacterium]
MYINSEQASISSQEFKQALFGIWLSDHPVKENFNKKLLRN